MAILVLHASLASSRAVVLHHLRSLAVHLEEPIAYHHVNAPVDDDMRRYRWRAIIFNYDFLQVRQSVWRDLLLEKFDFVARSECCKIAITMDDAFMCGILEDIILRFGCTHVFTPLYGFVDILYPRLRGRVAFHEMLTGYVDKDVTAGWMSKARCHAERPIDVGTRVRRSPASHGLFGLEKAAYAETFAEAASLRGGMTIDVSTRDADAFSGNGWYDFLGRCRATIAMKGGYGLVDRDGSCRARHDAFVARNPGATYEEIRAACFPQIDDGLRMAVESPRLLECAITFTTQIMPPESYLGDLEPWKHYIPLCTDLTGLNDALKALADRRLCESIAQRCHQALIQSDDFTAERFVGRVARVIGCPARSAQTFASQQGLAVLPAGRAAMLVGSWRGALSPFVGRALGYFLLFHREAETRDAAECVITQAATSLDPILVSTLHQEPLIRFIAVPSLLSLSAMANLVQCLGAADLWRIAIQQLAAGEIDAAALMPWDYSGSMPEVREPSKTGESRVSYLLDAALFGEAERTLIEESGGTSTSSWLQIALLRLARGRTDDGLDALLQVVGSERVEQGEENHIEAALASLVLLTLPLGRHDIAAVIVNRVMQTSHGAHQRLIRREYTFSGDGGDNDLRGGPGDDTLIGGLGNDRIYGDLKFSDHGGDDTAVLSYTFGSGYTVSGSANALHIVGAEGDDLYFNVENFQFAGSVAKTAAEVLAQAPFADLHIIEYVSVSHSSGQPSGGSGSPSISADGRFVAFNGGTPSIIRGDTNGQTDIFVYDRSTNSVERVSVASNGTEANGTSSEAAISADGRYVVFMSNASNLVPNDSNGLLDIFVVDRDTNSIERISIADDGTQGNQHSGHHPSGGDSPSSISSDGRFVAFTSLATNLVPDDTNGIADVFVYDRNDHTIERVSLAHDGGQGFELFPFSYGFGPDPSMSGDGRFVAFSSGATNLVPNDTNQVEDIFVRDRFTSTTIGITSSLTHSLGANNESSAPVMSADGRFVAFVGPRAGFAIDPAPANNVCDIYVYDLITGTLEGVSNGLGGVAANQDSFAPAVSGDGRFVTFGSYASNLVSADTNGRPDTFVHDHLTHTTQRILANNGVLAANPQASPSISPDGRFIAVESPANNLVPNDTNGEYDVFVIDRRPNSEPVAHDDATATGEDATVISNLLADNGSGADSDGDGDNLAVTAINGSAANVASQVTLTSGALLTANPDGRFAYNPNGAFGALNSGQIALDSFTYTIADGQGHTNTATVTIAILGQDDGLLITGGAGEESFTGTAQDDQINAAGGNDNVSGGAGYDWAAGWNW